MSNREKGLCSRVREKKGCTGKTKLNSAVHKVYIEHNCYQEFGNLKNLTQWTWVWVNSGSWWWTGRSGELRFTGSQRVGHDWATELNWTERINLSFLCPRYLSEKSNAQSFLGDFHTLTWNSFWLLFLPCYLDVHNKNIAEMLVGRVNNTNRSYFKRSKDSNLIQRYCISSHPSEGPIVSMK